MKEFLFDIDKNDKVTFNKRAVIEKDGDLIKVSLDEDKLTVSPNGYFSYVRDGLRKRFNNRAFLEDYLVDPSTDSSKYIELDDEPLWKQL